MNSNNMKARRIEQGLSMKDLSFKTQISERYLYFIENGQKNPSLKTARIISDSLECSIEDIFLHQLRTNDSYNSIINFEGGKK